MKRNILLTSDSYKYSHSVQYPPNTQGMVSYIEARAGEHLFYFGLWAYIQEYLLTPFTQDDIEEAAELIAAHGEPFNRAGWEYILNTYNGYMPVRINSVKEGTVLPNRNVLLTIECTDPKCFWVASFLETSLLRAIWYGSSVATMSYDCRQTIKKYMEMTSDTPDDLAFKFHDFGNRGVSSGESAMLGGMGHLATGAMGTDNIEALVGARRYYGAHMAGFSIPASEHSTITSWGKEHEVDAYRNMIKQYGGTGKIFACVSDSYDIYKACEMWGTVLKQDIIDSGCTVVVRPDSGDPASTVNKCIEILAEHFGTTINSKGFKVLPSCIRVIQGDGINRDSIEEILRLIHWNGFSADNIAFGCGGALLQHMNRDTYGFAQKCCALLVDGVWRDVFKEAVGKNSKRGRLGLYTNPKGEYFSLNEDELMEHEQTLDLVTALDHQYFLLKTVDGYRPKVTAVTLDEVRSRGDSI